MRVLPKAALLAFLYCSVSSVTAAARDSASISGFIGLNTVPSARMDQSGTFRTTISHDGMYTHGAAGVQISDRLYLGLRQTSGKENGDTHLYPGMDLKLRLFNERRWRPEISLGLQSALGHKRMAAEFLAMSKRYHNFDFTFGVGWGRMGTRGRIPNPLLVKSLSSSRRDLDGENPNRPSDWFKGDAALFGGVQYDLPIEGLSLKADWSGDSYRAEQAANSSFHVPAPWSVGIAYRPYEWIDAGIALRGTDQILARVSFSPQLAHWPITESSEQRLVSFHPRFKNSEPPIKKRKSKKDKKMLRLELLREDKLHSSAQLNVNDLYSPAFQIGQAARALHNWSKGSVEQMGLQLSRFGLVGPTIILNRRDLEQAEDHHQGSAEEIWSNVTFADETPVGLGTQHFRGMKNLEFKTDLVTDVSLSEDDAGVLVRTALIPSFREHFLRNFVSDTALRINMADNLDHLAQYRGVNLFPVRADIDAFTRKRVILERQFVTAFTTLAEDFHFAARIGYLEEMYAGMQGEILYRPFAKRWALGFDAAQVFKRKPDSSLAVGLSEGRILTAHLNGYYAIPKSNTTLSASVGRYLAGDIGGSVGLSNELDNGVKIAAQMTATNRRDHDIYGGKTNLYTGVSLSLPIGGLSFIPNGSRVITNVHPLGRDSGQRLDNAMSLYDVTEPMSYRAITRRWSELLPSARESR